MAHGPIFRHFKIIIKTDVLYIHILNVLFIIYLLLSTFRFDSYLELLKMSHNGDSDSEGGSGGHGGRGGRGC